MNRAIIPTFLALLLTLSTLGANVAAHATNIAQTFQDDPAAIADRALAATESVAGEGRPIVLPAGYMGSLGSQGPAKVGTYELRFTCPTPPVVGSANIDCPITLVDTDDLMGDPALAVDPFVDGRYTVASLHGGDGDGPTPVSRGGQQFTTYTTFGAAGAGGFGQTWQDNPYSAPSPPNNRDRIVFGEDVASVMDDFGNLYIASLYSHRNRETSGPYSSTVVTWKFDPSAPTYSYLFPSNLFETRDNRSMIDRVWMTHVPATGKVALLWRESMPDGELLQIAGRNLTSWISGAWSNADVLSEWNLVDDSMIFGPCEEATQPVVFETQIYMACRTGEGYSAITGVDPGDIVVHSLDPVEGTFKAWSKTPLNGGRPQIAVDQEGDVVVATVKTTGDGAVEAQLTVGRDGRRWSPAWNFDESIRNESYVTKRAWISGMTAHANTSAVHLIFAEDREGVDVFGETIPRFGKRLMALDLTGKIIFDLDLDLRDKGKVFRGGTYRMEGVSESVFEDYHDSLFILNGKEYIAFGDYGLIRFSMIATTDLRMEVMPSQAPPPPPPEPVPVVQAAGVSVGVAAGATTIEAARRALAARNAAAQRDGGGGKRR